MDSGSEDNLRRERQGSVDLISSRQRQASVASYKSSLSFLGSKKQHHYSRFTNSIHDYELLSGIGGVDDVSFLVLAKHIPTGEFIGLKYTDLSLSPDFEFITELTEAVRNTSFCKHPAILPYFTTFIDKEMEKMWTVTMPMRAGTCRKIMNDYFPDGFAEPVVATILVQVLRAIIYMHENHMIHNDIRADNILMDFTGEIRVTGLRQMVSLAQHGAYVASVFSRVGDNIEWAAPELMAQNNNYDERADIYSFGITALELAFNRTPFDGWPALKVLLSKLEYDCPGIDTDKAMSPSFYKLVKSCLRKDASERPSAQELMDHPFLKNARNARYLELHVVKESGLLHKHDQALQAAGATAPQSELGASRAGTLSRKLNQEQIEEGAEVHIEGGSEEAE